MRSSLSTGSSSSRQKFIDVPSASTLSSTSPSTLSAPASSSSSSSSSLSLSSPCNGIYQPFPPPCRKADAQTGLSEHRGNRPIHDEVQHNPIALRDGNGASPVSLQQATSSSASLSATTSENPSMGMRMKTLLTSTPRNTETTSTENNGSVMESREKSPFGEAGCQSIKALIGGCLDAKRSDAGSNPKGPPGRCFQSDPVDSRGSHPSSPGEISSKSLFVHRSLQRTQQMAISNHSDSNRDAAVLLPNSHDSKGRQQQPQPQLSSTPQTEALTLSPSLPLPHPLTENGSSRSAEQNRIEKLVKEKSQSEVIETLKGMQFLLKKCRRDENEAKKQMREALDELAMWKRKAADLEHKMANEKEDVILTRERRTEVSRLRIQKNAVIGIQSSNAASTDSSGNESSGSGSSGNGSSGNGRSGNGSSGQTVTKRIADRVSNLVSLKRRHGTPDKPLIAGLPPTGRFPGRAPPPPPKQTPKAENEKVSGLASLTEMLFKRKEKEGRNEHLANQPAATATASVKPKPPLHNRLQFFWVGPATGSPSKLSKPNNLITDVVSDYASAIDEDLYPPNSVHAEDKLRDDPELIAKSVELHAKSKRPPDRVLFKDSLSIYSCMDASQRVDILKDKRIEESFTKKKPDKVLLPTKPFVPSKPTGQNTKRGSVLGPAASQKYHITVRCFSKAFDGWDGFKRAILECRLGSSQINLLLETIPDPDAPQVSRRLQEWQELVEKVQQFRKTHPQEELYQDEAFVYYISTIPNLHQRLQCMNVMQSFDELLSRFHSEIAAFMDAVEMLFQNKEIPKLFRAILDLGNYLNEGLKTGDRKWFRLATLKKVVEFKGSGPQAKSFLYFVAYHLGPVLSIEELIILQKASQVSILQTVHNVLNMTDIFKLLSEQQLEDQISGIQYNNNKSILSTKRRNSILPGQDDDNDRFAEVSRLFVRVNKPKFMEVKDDLKRLLQDYQLCCQYFGDVEAFIPIDRKIEDERNPGQQRFVPDLIAVFNEFFSSYKKVWKDIATEQEKEKLDSVRKIRKQAIASSSSSDSLSSSSDNHLTARPSAAPIERDGGATSVTPSTNSPTLMKDGNHGGQPNMPPATNAKSTTSLGPRPSDATSECTRRQPQQTQQPCVMEFNPLWSKSDITPHVGSPFSTSSTSCPPVKTLSNHPPLTAVTSDMSDMETHQLRSTREPYKRASLRPSLFGVGLLSTSTTQTIDDTVLRDAIAVQQLNAPEEEEIRGHASSRHQDSTIDSPQAVTLTGEEAHRRLDTAHQTGSTHCRSKRRDSLRALNTIVHTMSKDEKAGASSYHHFGTLSSSFSSAGFNSSQFKYIDENAPPCPGAKLVPGFSSGINDLKHLSHHSLHSRTASGSHSNTASPSGSGSHTGTFLQHLQQAGRPGGAALFNHFAFRTLRFPSNRPLDPLPECPQESEYSNSNNNDNNHLPTPPSVSLGSTDRGRQGQQEGSFSDDTSCSNPHSHTVRAPSSDGTAHGSSMKQTPSSSSSASPVTSFPSLSRFAKPTSASVGRTVQTQPAVNGKAREREEVLKRIRSTYLKE